MGSAVPTSSASRLARFGALAGGIAGGMLRDGVRQLADGKRPRLNDLLLTPANALKVTHQLAHLRGAAMKVGQLLSMDAGHVLPPELADILAWLRSDAQPMPVGQLRSVLITAWGEDWEKRFAAFSFDPMAAASIGQVHRATTKDGRELAIKVQYPGVRKSIDSDVDSVATLIRLSGILPANLDLAPLLAEAKRQLHDEADYAREARYLAQFASLLAQAPEFQVPDVDRELSTEAVLAMSYIDSLPIEDVASAPQAERDRVMTALASLVLRELFAFRVMQTDPNFANYRYNPTTMQIVLLDFGATREINQETAQQYRDVLRAGLSGDQRAVRDAALRIGFFDEELAAPLQAKVLDMIDMIMQPLRSGDVFDFAASDVATRLRDSGFELASDRNAWHVPPIETLFPQRKFGGMFLLGSRLRARVDLSAVVAPYL